MRAWGDVRCECNTVWTRAWMCVWAWAGVRARAPVYKRQREHRWVCDCEAMVKWCAWCERARESNAIWTSGWLNDGAWVGERMGCDDTMMTRGGAAGHALKTTPRNVGNCTASSENSFKERRIAPERPQFKLNTLLPPPPISSCQIAAPQFALRSPSIYLQQPHGTLEYNLFPSYHRKSFTPALSCEPVANNSSAWWELPGCASAWSQTCLRRPPLSVLQIDLSYCGATDTWLRCPPRYIYIYIYHNNLMG